ncbi:PLEKHM1 [Mytilus edulis]|uniref:PLEKHM1 n=1 Tax=Mytilus edulis TaxID=6550 RepID=A0A8S3UIY6_MYTED|nr:PLEKHM1 [Mytilus edulis]
MVPAASVGSSRHHRAFTWSLEIPNRPKVYGKPRVCTFDAGYYCFECHENDEYYIPAMLIHNWDFRKHPVAKCNYKFLQDAEDQTKIDISKVNPKLYEHVKEMEDLRVLRTQLYYLKTYLFTCKQSIADEFRQTLWPREYMYENIHLYSLSDFLQVPSGTLLTSLRKVIKFAIKHVYDCRLCSQKGYICELCNQTKSYLPFLKWNLLSDGFGTPKYKEHGTTNSKFITNVNNVNQSSIKPVKLKVNSVPSASGNNRDGPR